VLQKKNFNGPSWYSLCQQAKETIVHLIVACPYRKEVWKEVERMIELRNAWECEDIEETFRSWYAKTDTKKIKALPINIAWGAWLAKNLKLFEINKTLPLKCVVQGLNILNAFPQNEDKQNIHELKEEVIEKDIP
jgi:hypothetical protein